MKNNNNIIDTFTYNGNVNLYIKDLKRNKIIESKCIHNAGTLNLFKFLCQCLSGQFQANLRPKYLDASRFYISAISNNKFIDDNSFSTSLHYRSLLTDLGVKEIRDLVLLQTGKEVELGNYQVSYSAVILKDQIDSNAQVDGLKSLVLTNSSNQSDITNSILAWINLVEDDTNDGIKLGDNQALIIEWQLSFNNYIKNIIEE